MLYYTPPDKVVQGFYTNFPNPIQKNAGLF